MIELLAPAAVVAGLIVGLWIFVKAPEIYLGLFLTAGAFKADDLLALPGGVDLTVLLCLLVMAAVAFRVIFVNRLQIARPPYCGLAILAALALLMLMGLLYTPAPQYGQDKALRFLVLVGVAFCGPLVLLTDRRRLRNFLLVFVALALAMSLDVLTSGSLGAWGPVAAFGTSRLNYGRVGGFALVSVVTLFLAQEQMGLLQRFVWLVVTLMLTATVILSASRGPMLATVAALGVAVLLAVRLRTPYLLVRNRNLIWLMGLVVVAALLIVYVNPGGILDYALSRINDLLGQDQSSSIRVSLYGQALEIFRENPLLGAGPGSFSVLAFGEDFRYYPHNIFLEFAAEFGLVGLILFGLLVATVQVEYLRALRGNRARALSLALIAVGALFWFTLFNAMVTGDITDNRLAFAMLGAQLAMAQAARRLGHERQPAAVTPVPTRTLLPAPSEAPSAL